MFPEEVQGVAINYEGSTLRTVQPHGGCCYWNVVTLDPSSTTPPSWVSRRGWKLVITLFAINDIFQPSRDLIVISRRPSN